MGGGLRPDRVLTKPAVLILLIRSCAACFVQRFSQALASSRFCFWTSTNIPDAALARHTSLRKRAQKFAGVQRAAAPHSEMLPPRFRCRLLMAAPGAHHGCETGVVGIAASTLLRYAALIGGHGGRWVRIGWP